MSIPGTGRATTILEDADPVELDRVEAAYQAGQGAHDERAAVGARRTLGNVASIGFGGPDLRTVYLGSLDATRIASFRSPIAGARPVQWDY